MGIVSQSEFRANLAKYLDQVERDNKELIVTRQGKSPLVVMPLEELESWKETLHLMGSKANAVRLSEAVDRLRTGEAIDKSDSDLGL
ncbi:MAG: prevent-host-death family protein [Phyllobacteriaceae bacterium]|uniref:type II toxin-antitoxin system Phd/YefM family antitoxin n=1 Tax=Zhengella sedimenti TaxID=3390035 RepID=UPI000C619540|nr:prevent-host-death family protein [Phyllobacteriaceae bacterium]MBA93091.1 prevent-host-death family protein [Phyllobacteriaceae bacterium]